MKSKVASGLVVVFFSLISAANAAEHSHNHRPDDHAPIGVMRDHIHKQGELMFSYRYEFMKMKGMRRGTNRVSSDEVLSSYMMSPTSMDMKMHMLGAMYGITDKFTISAMGSVIDQKMYMTNRSSEDLKRETKGFGDSKVNLMHSLFDNGSNRAQMNFGLSIPTGDIKRDYNGTRLPYAMQLGSGSYELLPGLSYSGKQETFSYGAQTNATIRLNENSLGYKLGNSYNITAWTAKKLNDAFSISSRLNYTYTQAVKGSDQTLNLMMSPANDGTMVGGKKLDFLLGTNFIATKGFFQGHRLAAEFGMPIYQNLRGLQLETDYKFTLGWQKAF